MKDQIWRDDHRYFDRGEETMDETHGHLAPVEAVTPKARKIHRLMDIRVVCDVPSYVTVGDRTLEQREKSIRRWVSDFHDFLRDHRSQDPTPLSVEPEYKDLCSECEAEWEPYTEDGKTFCANCGVEVV